MTQRTLNKCLHPVYNSSLVFLLAEIYRLQAFIYKEEFLIDKTMYKLLHKELSKAQFKVDFIVQSHTSHEFYCLECKNILKMKAHFKNESTF